jgi:lipopolysaccharide/colanic/teichoic acid biosynthesis glycosyltransferase
MIPIIAMNRRFYLVCKQLLDWILAFLLLLLLSPLLTLISVGVAIDLGSPVLFSQWRGGYLGQRFQILKFRTMRDAKSSDGSLLPDEARLTPFGNFLRKSSLDELPELINILRGEMSFVGPRPFIAQYLDRYTPEQARRHEALPGITGLAQVKGRNAISWEEKFELDIWYVDNWSLWLDLKIMVMTVLKVVQQDGINQEGYTTSEEFKGTLRES